MNADICEQAYYTFLTLYTPTLIVHNHNDIQNFKERATLLIAKIQLYGVPTTIHRSIRNHPPDKDIPSYEIVNPQARYCAIKKRCLYAYLNYYDIDTGKILGTMGGDFIKENQVSFFLSQLF